MPIETDPTLYDVTITVQEIRRVSIRAKNEAEARDLALQGRYHYFESAETQTLRVENITKVEEALR